MEGNFVGVWQGSLNVEPEILAGMINTLSAAEQQKAADFKLPIMRQRYIAVRFLLRQTLANYLQTDPRALQFQVDTYGKPSLACGSLHFNISHTADWLLIAVANFADIGVDIEQIKPRSSVPSLAARCFSNQEMQAWHTLPATRQLAMFYSLWTKKEAFVKAVGRGIALGLERCEVQLQAGGQLQSIPAEFGTAADWQCTELPVEAGYIAALVTPACRFELRRLRLETELPFKM